MKSYVTQLAQDVASVAPFAGAWIEIGGRMVWMNPICVAPFAGAWIEGPVDKVARRSFLW